MVVVIMRGGGGVGPGSGPVFVIGVSVECLYRHKDEISIHILYCDKNKEITSNPESTPAGGVPSPGILCTNTFLTL